MNNQLLSIGFETEGIYDIPIIEAVDFKNNTEFIPFNYAKSTKDRAGKSVQFFVDDYQFERLWNNPNKYIPILEEFDYVCSPDFSLYTDYPKVLQIYNHYKKHWLAAYWQLFGIKVIPTIAWSDEESFDWCFDGEPKNSTVAISSVGTQKNPKAKERFLIGYNEMMKRLTPKQIIFSGKSA